MASKESFKGFQKLSIKALLLITQLPSTAAKELLSKELGIPPYADSQDVQKAPFITYIYDNIMFAAEKGFPWEHVTIVVKFAHDFLKKILVENHQLSDAVKDFRGLADVLAPLSDRHKQQYTDFVFETVLCHYNLYKYVFTHLRDIVHPKVKKEVEAPPTPEPLRNGKDVVVWQYEEKIKEVSEKESALLCHQRDYIEKIAEMPTGHKTLDALPEVPLPYSKMTLNDLVKDVLTGYTKQKEKELKEKVNCTAKELELKLEKTAMPRPAVLGSPPRFKPKSPIGLKTQNTGMSVSSLKPDKDKKSAKSRSGRTSVASNASKK